MTRKDYQLIADSIKTCLPDKAAAPKRFATAKNIAV